MSTYKPRTKQEVAHRVAQDIPEGAYVNLGIGQPTLVANFISPDREVILQSCSTFWPSDGHGGQKNRGFSSQNC